MQVVDGNSVTKDMAAAGQVKIGYTDTDDAKEALEDGAHVEMCFTDQEEGGIGNLITPNTAALIKGAPNEKNAKIFIDYILLGTVLSVEDCSPICGHVNEDILVLEVEL